MSRTQSDRNGNALRRQQSSFALGSRQTAVLALVATVRTTCRRGIFRVKIATHHGIGSCRRPQKSDHDQKPCAGGMKDTKVHAMPLGAGSAPTIRCWRVRLDFASGGTVLRSSCGTRRAATLLARRLCRCRDSEPLRVQLRSPIPSAILTPEGRIGAGPPDRRCKPCTCKCRCQGRGHGQLQEANPLIRRCASYGFNALLS